MGIPNPYRTLALRAEWITLSGNMRSIMTMQVLSCGEQHEAVSAAYIEHLLGAGPRDGIDHPITGCDPPFRSEIRKRITLAPASSNAGTSSVSPSNGRCCPTNRTHRTAETTPPHNAVLSCQGFLNL